MMTVEREEILRRSLDKIAQEYHYEDCSYAITPVTAAGVNYTSELFLATFSAPNKPDLKLFAKVASIGETFRSQLLTDIFSIEHYFYNTLSKIYDDIQDKCQVPQEHRLVIPKFYHYDGTYLEETLVLQDMTAEGYGTLGRLEPMSYEYASKAIEELAKMHALSIAFQEEYPDEFKKASEILKFKSLEESKSLSSALQQGTSKAVAAVRGEHRGRLQWFLDSEGPDFMLKSMGPLRRPVLAHADFRISNTMYRKKGDNLDVLIIDYQCVHGGVGVRDVLYLLLPATDEHFRARHFRPLLDQYYDCVCAALRRLRHDPDQLFPRGDYDFEVKKSLPVGMMVALFMLPALTAAEAPPAGADFDIADMARVPTTQLFHSRLNGLVDDCVRWGVI